MRDLILPLPDGRGSVVCGQGTDPDHQDFEPWFLIYCPFPEPVSPPFARLCRGRMQPGLTHLQASSKLTALLLTYGSHYA
jgi:hypothetical protein